MIQSKRLSFQKLFGSKPGDPFELAVERSPRAKACLLVNVIHVTDLAQAHILSLKYLENGGGSDIFNLGNGVGFSVKEVIEAARKVSAHNIPAVISPRRAGDPAKLVASSSKARKVLGWTPVYTDLEEIISTAWKWHKKHPGGFSK